MHPFQSKSCTAFAGTQRIASGEPRKVARAAKKLIDGGDMRILLVFDDATAEHVEIDFRGSMRDVLARLSTDPVDGAAGAEDSGAVSASTTASTPASAPASALTRAPGRPKLGVVGREVTLLPRHWEWLNAQPGGASVALRKLVEQARRVNKARDRIRGSQEVAFRFMSAMAGDEPGFEEASRALFAGGRQRFEEQTESWPKDVRDYATTLAAGAFPEQTVLAEGETSESSK